MFLARKTGASVVCSQVRHTSLVWFLNQVLSVQVIIRPRQINFTLNEKIIYMKKFAGSKFVSKTVPQCNWTLTDLFSGTISLRYLIGSYVFLLFICKSQCFEILAFYFLVFALFSSFCSQPISFKNFFMYIIKAVTCTCALRNSFRIGVRTQQKN